MALLLRHRGWEIRKWEGRNVVREERVLGRVLVMGDSHSRWTERSSTECGGGCFWTYREARIAAGPKDLALSVEEIVFGLIGRLI